MPRRATAASVTKPATASRGVSSVDRALSLLQVFTVASPICSLSELAEQTHQYKSTVLRMMASLESADLVRRHLDGRFSLGPTVARLGAVHHASFSLGEVVRPLLLDLVAATRESAAFHVPRGDQDLCLYRVDSPQPVRDHLRAGDLQPLTGSAAGLVMLAYRDGHGGRSARIRREQLLVDDGRIVAELAAAAAPVFAPDGALAGVLELRMPSVRFESAVAAQVAQFARQITARIGGICPETLAKLAQGRRYGGLPVAAAATPGTKTKRQSR